MSGTAPPSTLARILRVTSPEMMAGALSVLVSVVVLAFVLTSGSGTGEPNATHPSSAPPSDGLIGGGPVASATSPAVDPSASATATGSETWTSEARVLLQGATNLAELRDSLARTAAERPGRAADIARQLRALNPSLSATLDLVEAMETKGAPPELVAEVRNVLSTALARSLETLRASLPNVAAYRTGAAEVIGSLSDLEALMARVEGEAGLGPVSSP